MYYYIEWVFKNKYDEWTTQSPIYQILEEAIKAFEAEQILLKDKMPDELDSVRLVIASGRKDKVLDSFTPLEEASEEVYKAKRR